MDLLVVRHAIAEDREVFAESGRDDAERPLTANGRRKFRRAARGLGRLVTSIDLLATSDLTRALETGEILGEECRIGRTEHLRELAPDADPAALIRWVKRQPDAPLVGVIGHEPHLSRLVEYLLTGLRGAGFVQLKKGGACLVALGDAPAAGHAELRWLLTAGQLRRIGGR
jgi:phosphohistidine phosphatase